ncbi:Translation initiation factor subunit 2B [Melioribacter roseus P3M-2]|uniref:Translation initiation factor subunit 2B n=1 Tax=Melioribacter roseus (strain DSM 23840 / JCM 17771 / VKM B-2668 / P3M-2) TaxID=1191523 RepID=I7A805_MELRP|nr:Translation initiation factor subunit 2B [Melioribacter roseus]AFN76001.1 Translation initiation factor subunit 2B [Melioribacter roseus P3M-2]
MKNFTDDNISGSSELLEELHKHLKSQKNILPLFPDLLDNFGNKFATFENIRHYLRELRKAAKTKKSLDEFFEKYDRLILNIYDNIYQNCRNRLVKYSSFITISNSKTVYEILKRLTEERDNLKAAVAESRPQFEGRVLARRLHKTGINVKLITEAMIYNETSKYEAGIIGADAVLKSGNVVNKTGSGVLALACKHRKIPLYVVCDRKKFSGKNKFENKIMPPEEIWKTRSGIKIENYYFEEIDKNLITEIFTD